MSQLLLSQNFLTLFLLFILAVVVGGVILGTAVKIGLSTKQKGPDVVHPVATEDKVDTITKAELAEIVTNLSDPKIIPWSRVQARRHSKKGAVSGSLWK